MTESKVEHNSAMYESMSARRIVAEATERGKNPAAVALGRLGGLKGGPARARKLPAQRRREIAETAARARWQNR